MRLIITKPPSCLSPQSRKQTRMKTCVDEKLIFEDGTRMTQEQRTSYQTGSTGNATEHDEHETNSNFECNICLDVAKDAVVSYCGHLFCWGCLHKWLETRPNRSVCPVCKAGISKDKVVPLYGRGNPNPQDPREKLPPRPQAQRPEPETTFNPFPGFNFGGNNGFQVSLGIGAFPFTVFNTFGNTNQNRAPPGSQQAQEEQFLSKLFLWIAFLFLMWLFLA